MKNEDYPELFEDQYLAARLTAEPQALDQHESYLREARHLSRMDRFVLFQERHRLAVEAGKGVVGAVSGFVLAGVTVKAVRAKHAH